MASGKRKIGCENAPIPSLHVPAQPAKVRSIMTQNGLPESYGVG